MISVRNATEDDLKYIESLESLSFSEPWSYESLRTHLASPLALTMVAEEDGVLLGYVYGSVIPPESELYRIAVDRSARRRGAGFKLLEKFLQGSSELGGKTTYLEVRESNTAARKLYERAGFALVGIRKNYYRSPLENAAVLVREEKI